MNQAETQWLPRGQEKRMDDLLVMAASALEQQPFSQMLGTQLVSIGSGTADLAVAIHGGLKQQHGFVHGGVVSYLADNALTFAGGSILGNSVTLEMKINYLKPAVGDRLVASAKVVSSSKRLAVCECRVSTLTGSESALVAFATGTIYKVEGS
jgi:uncharacterized protein (TIGR00369 family)